MNGLQAIREVYDLTLEQIADMLGVKRQSVCEWCRPDKKMPKKRISQLSVLLDLPEHYFRMEEIAESDMVEIRKFALEKSMEDASSAYKSIVYEKGEESQESAYIDSSASKNLFTGHILELSMMETKAIDMIKNAMSDIKDTESEEEYLIRYRENISLFSHFTDVISSRQLNVDLVHQVLRAMDLLRMNEDEMEKLSLDSERAMTMELYAVLLKYQKLTNLR